MDADRLKTTMTISKAIALITDKHSCQMVQRHVRALNRIANNYKHGFLLKDLTSLGQLVQLCVDRVQQNTEYEEPLCKVIRVCSKPFLKEKSSDENKYAAAVIETFVLLGKIMSKCPLSVCCEIASTVAAFYTDRSEEEYQALSEEHQETRRTYNTVLIERSSVAKYIAESLERFSDNRDGCISILNSILTLSTSATNCNHMLLARVTSSVCSCLSSLTDTSTWLFVGVEIIWNLLQHGSQIQVAEQLSGFNCIRMLQKLFKNLMLKATSQQDKQLRNDVLMITSLIASLCPEAPFVETGFLSDLCEFATFSEDGRLLSESMRQLKLTQEHEDFELKKALISLLITLSNQSSAAVQVLSQHKITRALFSYVTANDKTSSDWTLAQFEELQLLALSCLSILSPQCIDDYMICQGNTRLLLLIEWCTKMEGQFTGFGNSFHGQGGCGTRISQLRYSLRLLLSMSNTGDEALHQDLHEQGAIPVLIGLLQQFLEQTDMDDDSVHLEMQADCLLILSCLCEMNSHRKELFGGYDGVQILIQYLKKDPLKFSSGLGHHRLLLAATDCTWCSVVGNSMVEDVFLENEGIFVLLDLLQVSPKNMRGLVLGVLVDMCDNPKAIPHVTAWRGKSQPNAWSLLVHLWRQEEADLEVPRDVMNTVAGTTLPLVGADQSRQGMPPLSSNQPSPSIMDVSENMRAKIYALCTKLGFQSPLDSLTTEDKITMCIIQSYLDFKSGEVWYEVASELAQEGLRPITPDQEGLQEILQCAEEKTEEVIKQQHELIDEQHRKDLDEEYLFYEQLRDYQLTKERMDEKHDKFVQRTSNYKALKDAKQEQQRAIDGSRSSAVNLGERFHVVEQNSLNVTVFSGRHVAVVTTPMKLLSTTDTTHQQPTTTTTAAEN